MPEQSSRDEDLTEFDRTLAVIAATIGSEGPVFVSEAQQSFRDRYVIYLKCSPSEALMFMRRERARYERSTWHRPAVADIDLSLEE